jgi:hypothetical protein
MSWFRYRVTALLATELCMDIHMRPHRKLGPVPPPVYHFHPVEVVIGQYLSLPLFPARIEERPDPLGLGIELLPPWDETPRPPVDETTEPAPRRMDMRSWMRQVAQQLNPELGDAAHALRGASSRGARVRFLSSPEIPAYQEITA